MQHCHGAIKCFHFCTVLRPCHAIGGIKFECEHDKDQSDSGASVEELRFGAE